jgi:hypothetical protein
MVNILTSYFGGLVIKSGPQADRRLLSLAATEDRILRNIIPRSFASSTLFPIYYVLIILIVEAVLPVFKQTTMN